ncbi:MAG: nicotinate (nicotinamide) nucleotide adenylyltransferase [Planctomycetes bacterium]|nr:nicotinate (nicotinamide) nucleotide adenylyltransferase [Planctomycetota bacterium]
MEAEPRPGSPRRIGLFGGSFDPVHAGHLHVARAAGERFGLDRIVFVPAAQSPFKPDQRPAAGEHRLAMLRLALAGEPEWSASAIELDRGGPSWTIDTVRALPKAIGEREDCALYLVLGSDNLPALPQWKESRALLERVQPIVIFRDGDASAQLEPLRAMLGDALAKKVEAGYLRLPPVAVSSTEVRAALARGEREVAGVPSSVLDYIRAHRLYGARA